MTLAPDACHDMKTLRAQIDRIDLAILDLLQARAGYIDRAIVLKRREAMPARTTDRVAEVIAGVRNGAGLRGLDPDLAERLWHMLIEAAIAHEEKALHRQE